MKITREQISKSRVKLTITVDADFLADAEKVALSKLKKDVKVDGFRKGKVPVEVVKKHINPNVLAEETV
jgi:trigger factor